MRTIDIPVTDANAALCAVHSMFGDVMVAGRCTDKSKLTCQPVCPFPRGPDSTEKPLISPASLTNGIWVLPNACARK
jgi:hypothetical protein